LNGGKTRVVSITIEPSTARGLILPSQCIASTVTAGNIETRDDLVPQRHHSDTVTHGSNPVFSLEPEFIQPQDGATIGGQVYLVFWGFFYTLNEEFNCKA